MIIPTDHHDIDSLATQQKKITNLPCLPQARYSSNSRQISQLVAASTGGHTQQSGHKKLYVMSQDVKARRKSNR